MLNADDLAAALRSTNAGFAYSMWLAGGGIKGGQVIGKTDDLGFNIVEGEKQRFDARKSFTYAVLSPDGKKELGCVYVSPSRKEGYDAQVRVWVTKAKFDEGFEKELIPEVKSWLSAKWPFQKIAWPGREISREDFAKLPNK